MAESDLEKNADFTQIYNKHHGEEDPLVAAQRYLNIFRQLHIFSTHKRQEFEDLLVKLPLPIKQAFSQLPGGSVLHDFVNELEAKAGVEISAGKAADSADVADASFSQSRILASALAEANAQPLKAISSSEAQRLSEEINQRLNAFRLDFEKSLSSRDIDLKNLDPAVLNNIQKAIENKIGQNNFLSSGTMTVSPSPEFKESIESVVDKFLAETKQNQSQNTAELAKIIEKNSALHLKANTELVSALKSLSEHSVQASSTESPVETIIDNIVEKQTKLLKEFSQEQSDTLGNVLTNVLKENNSSSMEMFSNALDAFQKESSKILEMQVNLQKVLLQTSHFQSGSESQAQNFYRSPVSVEVDSSISRLADSLLNIDAVTKKKKKKKKKKKDTTSDTSLLDPEKTNNPSTVDFSGVSSDRTAPSDWGFTSASSSEQDNQAIELSKESSLTEETHSASVSEPQYDTNQEWEYVEDDGSDTASAQEWEYVEDDGSDTASAQEWEYVEDDGSDTASDQEWEYVEDDGSDTASAQEWEYVEDDSGDTASAQEWEYVEEDGSDTASAQELEYVEDNGHDILVSKEPESIENEQSDAVEHEETDSVVSNEHESDKPQTDSLEQNPSSAFVSENSHVVEKSETPLPYVEKDEDFSDAETSLLINEPSSLLAQKFDPKFSEKIELSTSDFSSDESTFIPHIKLSGDFDSAENDPYKNLNS